MSAQLSQIVDALHARKAGGANRYMARCPAHDDRNPSLSITEKAGKVLLKCFAGCEQRDVIAELKARGLWESETLSFEQRIVCAYTYADASGNPLYEVDRLHSPKDFRQRYADGRGGWIWKKHPRQVLYRLPELLEAPIVFVVEGEKDVETLRSYGFTATTNAGGANAPWLDSYTETLRGREVIIIPDSDPPGVERGRRIAKALLGHVARLIVWQPDGAKDITEWFERGHSELELIESITPEEIAQ